MKKRQAVVIIHGIGEQRPMKTLRGFVTSLLNFEKHIEGDHDPKRTFWTKPDRINDSYELRKISAMKRPDVRSTTHFYEYHWAANMRDTKWRHLYDWLKTLMSRYPSQIHWRLKILWFVILTAIIAWLFSCIWLIAKYYFFDQTIWDFSYDNLFTYVALVFPLFILFFNTIFIHYIGDAARYLTPSLDNIRQREEIRRKGLNLIRALQKTKDYDRIVLVGHSLGSVIAYDIITYLWIEFNKSISFGQNNPTGKRDDLEWGSAFKAGDEGLEILQNLSSASAILEEDESDVSAIHNFQNLQYKLWKKISNNRKGWLISDLITIGSPLTHGNLLMADSNDDFNLRILEREYPTCPPMKDDKKYYYENDDGQKIMHHATPFAAIRWSNIYYRGDFIGGELKNKFGVGINDIVVSYKGGWWSKLISMINPLSHNDYWVKKSNSMSIDNRREYSSIEAIYKAMRLNNIKL